MNGPPTTLIWTCVLVVGAQYVVSYSRAYIVAPREVATYIDAVEFSIQENDSYDRDVAHMPRLEDKMRLGRLLREIQRSGDDLREDLNKLLVNEDGAALKWSARLLWAGHRTGLEERVRRLDLLRMRFLVVHMGVLTSAAGEREKQVERAVSRAAEKTAAMMREQPRPATAHGKSLLESINEKKPLLRRLTTSAIGHTEKTTPPHRAGWLGVVEELQKSPLLKKRHQSIEDSMRGIRTPPPSPASMPSRLFEKTPSRHFEKTPPRGFDKITPPSSPRTRFPRTPEYTIMNEKEEIPMMIKPFTTNDN
ncbi:uncharacterized protein PG998_002245 [Apiospora kogelbergensis]|uniref:uncharacterized protein n=1 Tax=Apiospora kogelbergensis TaxID=1337665 RepID=UPI00312DB12B